MALLAAYNFESLDGGVEDVTGNGHDFTTLGSARLGEGHTGNGLQATNSGEGRSLVLEDPSWAQTDERTVMCWVRIPSNGSKNGYPVELHLSDENTGAWGLLILSGDMSIQARNASGFAEPRPGVKFPDDNLWHHWAATYDGSTLKLYQDGQLVASKAFAGPLRTDADVLWTWDGGNEVNTMDDLRFYDEALDQETIASLMNTPVAGAINHAAQVSFHVYVGGSIEGLRPGADTVSGNIAVGLDAAGAKSSSGTCEFSLLVPPPTAEGERTSGQAKLTWIGLRAGARVIAYGGDV